ncbi:MAG: hypothetical protein HQ542_09930 [Bacteroidia bacterium]|nr:hypothetical protein [Bacteroidia bacterium]
MSKRPSITISETDVQAMLADHYVSFREIVETNVYCYSCYSKGNLVGIRDYSIRLDDLNNIHLKGFCTRCGGQVARYIEYDEDPTIFARAEIFRKDNRSRFNLKKI